MTTHNPPVTGERREGREARESRARGASEPLQDLPWLLHGIASGALGAALVALFFLVVDGLAGRPLWTPAALGSRVFMGEALDPAASIPHALVLAYTLVHGAVFAAFGMIAASELALRRRRVSLRGGVLVAIFLFATFQASFVTLGAMFMPEVLGVLGAGRVAIANGLAAVLMAVYLARALRVPESERARA